MLSLLDPGDEVLVIEPTYATYEATVAAAGASVRADLRLARTTGSVRPSVPSPAPSRPRTRADPDGQPQQPDRAW